MLTFEKEHPPSPSLEFITVGELAKLLRLSNCMVYAMARRGELPSIRFGRSVRFSKSAVSKWICDWEKRHYPKFTEAHHEDTQ